ncbi:response regulator [Roseibacterium sp. SDUM158017]|uniref:response regulator n=1 Tax=Roseicyclus salinarum TaxID=3036773 RepID=UPI0024154F43|nr:response regulator [Roseibacterium sp. SDUM158017]MDG4650188.1 response regulator [Roseibacterium sp. SDUM158017]
MPQDDLTAPADRAAGEGAAMAEELRRKQHDIRGAVATITTGLRLLRDDRIGADPRMVAEHMLAATASLQEMMDAVFAADAEPATPAGTTAEALAPASSGPRPDLSGLAILVAEDSPSQRAILGLVLGAVGGAASFVENGEDALAALAGGAFDAALIDIEMPGLSGLEVMRAVRARGDAAAATPLVAITAFAERGEHEAIRAAGADGIVVKPVASAEALGRVILHHAGRGRRDGAALDAARLDELLSIAGADGARGFLEQLRDDLVSVRQKLDEGVAAGSAAAVRAQTHILVALAGAVGATRLCGHAEALSAAANGGRAADLGALHVPCRRDLDDLIALVERRAFGRG